MSKPPLDPDEEDRQGMILALLIVAAAALLFLAWIKSLGAPPIP
jgi:hypothetical protein